MRREGDYMHKRVRVQVLLSLCVLVLSSARCVELSKVVICWLVGVHLAVHVLLSVHVGA